MHGGPYPRRHRGGNHVDAGPQEPGDQCDIVVGVRGGGTVVHQRVGFQCNQRIHVVGGRQPEILSERTDFADVATHLLRVADPHANQFEQGVLDDFGDHHPADEAGAPDHDTLFLRLLHGLHHRRARDRWSWHRECSRRHPP